MSKSGERHPVRMILLLLLLAGGVVAVRNAIAEKGGSYDPADAGAR